MKKYLVTAVVVGLFLLSLKLAPTFASDAPERKQVDSEVASSEFKVEADEEQKEEVAEENEVTSIDDLRPNRTEQLNDIAAELGIATEGKDQETVAAEVREEVIKQRAADLGISVEGKDEEAIIEEIQQKYGNEVQAKENEEKTGVTIEDARNMIPRQPVDTGGKSLEEFKKEKQEEFMKIAQEHGINTEGKTMEEILAELENVKPKQ